MGFSTPLAKRVPIVNQFQTDSFADLQRWFKGYDKSTMTNIHLIEFLLTRANASVHSRPYILAAYGINIDSEQPMFFNDGFSYIINVKIKAFVRLVGFATDRDSGYLKAMRLSLGFFAQ